MLRTKVTSAEISDDDPSFMENKSGKALSEGEKVPDSTVYEYKEESLASQMISVATPELKESIEPPSSMTSDVKALQ